jgi:cytochrome c biogenesis protein ResB
MPRGVPGFHAFLTDSHAGVEHRGPASWVASGEVVPLTHGEDIVRVGYGLELKPMPFSVALTDFQVPRDEGTETPSDFRATVLFRDISTGKQRSGLIRMNHPAPWPGGLLAAITGLNYKFSQAEWNPENLKETTLQVLHDPGWMPKWVGSLAICLGIATMFYIRPRS